MDMLCVITFLLLTLIQEIESVLLKRTVVNSISNEIVLFASDEPSLLACAQRCRFIDKNAIIDFNGSRCTCFKGKTDEGERQMGDLKGVFVNHVNHFSSANQRIVNQAISPKPIDGDWSQWNLTTNSTNCTTTKEGGKRKVAISPKPINGDWSQWSVKTTCTKTKECGKGKRKVFERVCTKPEPAHGGFPCLTLSGKRSLKETKTESCVKCKMYKIEVKTSNEGYAGTDANVFIRLYGDKDFSDDVLLSKTTHEDFYQNNVANFKMEIIDVGKITKLELGHDNTGWGAGWHVEYVTFAVDGCETRFEIKDWFDDKRKTFENPKETCN